MKEKTKGTISKMTATAFAVCLLLITSNTRAGILFQDDFESFYTGSGEHKNNNGVVIGTNPSIWNYDPSRRDLSFVTQNAGSNNYFNATFDITTTTGNDGNYTHFKTVSNSLGFNNAGANEWLRYSVDVVNIDTDRGIEVLALNVSAGTQGGNWWGVTTGFILEMRAYKNSTWGRVYLKVRDGVGSSWDAGTVLFEGAYQGGEADKVWLDLEKIDSNTVRYSFGIEGYYFSATTGSTSGVYSGSSGFGNAFDTAYAGFFATNRYSRSNTDIMAVGLDNYTVEVVDENYATGLLNPVRENAIGLYLNQSAAIIEAAAQAAWDTMDANGSWSGLNYGAPADDDWDVMKHYQRVYEMARAYRKEGQSLYLDGDLAAAVEAALNYGENAVLNPSGTRPAWAGNWWYWEIALPARLGRTLVIMDDAIDAGVFQDGRDSLVWLIGLNLPAYEGANLAWVAERHIPLALIDNNVALMEEITDAFTVLTEPVERGIEGMMEDYSFHQHGELLYSGGYGASYSSDVSLFISGYVDGTAFQIPQANIDKFASYLVDGMQYTIYNGYWDTGVLGRNVTRGNQSRMGAGPGVSAMAGVQNASQDELIDFVDAPYHLQGHKHFWESDFTVHHRPDWYASVRMHSERTINAERMNYEGYKQWNVANGLLWVLRDGGEYVTNNVLATLDWTRLPGTTVEQKAKSESNYGYGDGSFVGGAFISDFGVATMDFANSDDTDLTAQKSWFFFDDEVVCLGSDINCPTANTVETIVAQIPLPASDTPLIVNGTAKPTNLGWNETMTNTQWAQCGDMGYYFPGGAVIEGLRQNQSGSWQDLKTNSTDTATYDNNFLTLWYDHGTNVSSAQYAYSVVSKLNLDMGQYASNQPFEILAHTDTLHAVKDRSTEAVGAVFRQAGSVDIISVDTPCVVFYMISDGRFTIAVSEPTHSTATIEVVIDLELLDPQLPAGVSSEVVGGQTILELNVENGRNYVSTFISDITTCADVWNFGGGGDQADLNRDCVVDIADFAIMAKTWLDCTDPANPNCN